MSTVLKPLAPPGTVSGPIFRPPVPVRKQPSAQAANRRFATSLNNTTQYAVPAVNSVMLYSNGHQAHADIPRVTVSDTAVNKPAPPPRPVEPDVAPVPQRVESLPDQRDLALVGLQGELNIDQYGSVASNSTEQHEVLQVAQKEAELHEPTVNTKESPYIPRRSTTEALVALSASNSTERRGAKRPESDDEAIFHGHDQRERSRPSLDLVTHSVARDRRGWTARRVRTVSTNCSMSYDALITSNPILQQVYEPAELRFARLEYQIEHQYLIEVMWFNKDVLDELTAYKGVVKRRRRHDRVILGEQKNTYEEEFSLHSLATDSQDEHSNDDSPSRSLVRRLSKTHLFNSADSLPNLSENASVHPARSLSSSTIMAPGGGSVSANGNGSSEPAAYAPGSTSSSSASASTSPPVAVGRPLLSVSDQVDDELPVGSAVDLHGSLIDPIPTETNVYGLYKLRAELERMLVAPHATRTSALYTMSQPPRRRLFVQSDVGSGVSTLIKSMCRARSLNFIRIHMPSDLQFSDDMFVKVIDYARMIQPCVVLFDRCDFWFRPNAYTVRGEKFVIAHAGYPMLAKEEVFFVFSASDPLQSLHVGFREFIAYRSVIESSLDSIARAKCFQTFIETWIHQMSSNPNEAVPKNIASIITDYTPQLERFCKLMAERHETFTPGMIKSFCDRVIESARTRATNEAIPLPNQPIYVYEAFPVDDDFSFVENLIDGTCPGTIIWKPC